MMMHWTRFYILQWWQKAIFTLASLLVTCMVFIGAATFTITRRVKGNSFIVIGAYVKNSCSLLWCANRPHLCFAGFSNSHVCRENWRIWHRIFIPIWTSFYKRKWFPWDWNMWTQPFLPFLFCCHQVWRKSYWLIHHIQITCFFMQPLPKCSTTLSSKLHVLHRFFHHLWIFSLLW